MANKYKQYAKQETAQDGEIVWTYGVEFKNSPEVKPHYHSQNRPYLILCREESGQFKALKLTTKIGGYMTEFRIPLEKYQGISNIKKATVIDTRHIVDIDPTEIIKDNLTESFILDDKDMGNLYMKMVYLYSLNQINIPTEQMRKIFERYITDRKPFIGSVLIVNYCKYYLLVVGEDENNYICLPLHRNKTENTEEQLSILKTPSYINYNEEYTISKNDIYFMKSFRIDRVLLKHILTEINKHKNINQNKKF